MANIIEKVVTEDLELGYGTASITNPAGGSLLGTKIGMHTLMGGNYINAADFEGSNAGVQIAAAMAALAEFSSSGGIIDAREFDGAQTISTDMFSGVTISGTLLFGAATFTVTARQNVPDNWRIIGLGQGITKFVCGTAAIDVFYLTNATNTELSGFTLTGSGVTTGTNLELGIVVTGTVGQDQNVHIHDVEITNQTTAIYILSVAKVKVSDCYIHGQVWDVDNSEGYGVLVETASGITVANNIFDSVPRHAIYFGGATDFIAHGNKIFDNNGSAINCQGDSTGVGWTERGIVSDNLIYGVTVSGAQTIPARGINLSGNARNILITGNEINGTEGEGIEVQGNDTYASPAYGISISNNRVVTSGAVIAIAINRARDNMVSGNYVEGNGSATPLITVSGSATHAATENTIIGNVVKNSATGISVNDDANTTGTIINGNMLVDCTTPITFGITTSEVGWNSENGSIIGRGDIGINITPTTNYNLHIERTFTAPTAEVTGVHSRMIALATAAANAFAVIGARGIVRIDPTNTQNWTNSSGLIGVLGDIQIGTGATGTISNSAGIFANATISAATVTNHHGVHVAAPTGAGTITTKRGVYVATGAGISEFLDGVMLDVVVTASLPAAAAAQNGRILIEDAGAGDRNLIIYAGAQRFRIDGGAAF